MKKLFLLLNIIPLFALGQNVADSIPADTIVNIRISDFSSQKDTLGGYDSLGRRQGEWWGVKIERGIAYFEENATYVYSGKEYGFYVDNKKEELWQVFDKNGLISHRVYKNNVIQYEIFYKKNRIRSILKPKINESSNNSQCIQEVIFFDKRGRVKAIRSITDNGILIKKDY